MPSETAQAQELDLNAQLDAALTLALAAEALLYCLAALAMRDLSLTDLVRGMEWAKLALALLSDEVAFHAVEQPQALDLVVEAVKTPHFETTELLALGEEAEVALNTLQVADLKVLVERSSDSPMGETADSVALSDFQVAPAA